MQLHWIFLLLIIFFSAKSDAAECEPGWVPYKDELCLKLFSELLTYKEAKDLCAAQASKKVKPSLVMIKNEEIQELVGNYSQYSLNNVWLGGKYDEVAGEFQWEDGDSLAYINWQETNCSSYPVNITDSVTCIELRPLLNDEDSSLTHGKWANVICQKRNLVMCQKDLVWSMHDAMNEIKRIRSQLETTEQKLKFTEESFQTTKKELQAVSSSVVPIGTIYIEYYQQPSPVELWSNLTWEDVTNSYAGLFFRASGGGSGEWGSVQDQCSPRVNQMQYTQAPETHYPNNIIVPANGWSELGHAGYEHSAGGFNGEAIRFHTAGCEVRPRNQAVRIWKRIA